MDSSLAVVVIVVLPVLAVTGSAFSNPGGVLALLATRKQRHDYRYRLEHRRFRPRPRSKQRSSKISAHLHRMVERADRHTCIGCGARWQKGTKRFAVDHMTPWIMGGLTCLWNSALLCQTCNSVKSCYWEAPWGQVYYRGRKQPPPRAREIWLRELRARRSLARWLRAFGLIPAW